MRAFLPRCPRAVRPMAGVGMLATLLLLVAGGPTGTATASAIPSVVLPGEVPGDDVALEPVALRAPEGRADLDVVVGEDAPADVVVTLGLAAVEVTADGSVQPGAVAAGPTITRGGRVAPGERLRATVAGVTAPVVATATITAAVSDPTEVTDGRSSTVLAALVLPGEVGPPPTVELDADDGQLRATVRAEAPVLVTARLVGAEAVTHPDRLVLPDQPLELVGVPAPWPGASEASVTDEAGRTVAAVVGRGRLAALAGGLLAIAVVALAAVTWRRRSVPTRADE